MSRLNYHHLYYFWRVAKQGNLTQCAVELHVSQSALSSQIKQLEQSMDLALFERVGRKLVLTEAGRKAFSYAEEIFKKGDELQSYLLKGEQTEGSVLRIGMLATMSRNFIENLVQPLVGRPKVKYSLEAREQTNLLAALGNHQFDLALTNIAVVGDDKQLWQCQLLARQPIAIVGPPGLKLGGKLSAAYKKQRWILPVHDSPIRSAFEGICAQHRFTPNIIAEANDMAMLRLLARDSGAISVLPLVVVKDELDSGKLVHYLTLENVFEHFYAVTIARQFPNNLVNELLTLSRLEM